MPNSPYEPTKENIFKTFNEDILLRNDDVFEFIKLLNTLDTNYSIALDGQWGSGKTFFVKHIVMVLDSVYGSAHSEFEPHYKQVLPKTPVDIKEDINKNFPIYFDAWENDNDDDPLLSLLYSIVSRYKVNFPSERNWSEALFEMANIALDTPISTAVTGGMNKVVKTGARKAVEIKEKFEGENIFEQIATSKNINERIFSFFDKIVNSRNSERIVIFIDELDRCKPSYAVLLLERIKHYMTHEKITFVFSTNLTELSHTIKQCYGGGFDGMGYLEKFFDYWFSLPQLTFEQQNNLIPLGSASPQDMVYEFFINKFNVSMRGRIKMITEIRKFVARNMDTGYYGQRGDACLSFAKCLFIPYVICLKCYNAEKYHAFIQGNDTCHIEDITEKKLLAKLIQTLIRHNIQQQQEEIINQKNVILQLYYEIFTPLTSDPNYANDRIVHEISLLPKIKDIIVEAASHI